MAQRLEAGIILSRMCLALSVGCWLLVGISAGAVARIPMHDLFMAAWLPDSRVVEFQGQASMRTRRRVGEDGRMFCALAL